MTSAMTLWGWGPFASAAMLAWGAAAAIPIVIHLWNRRHHQEQRWAAMEFLLAAIQKTSRRLRFEQWLVLAIRALTLVLLAVALAEPQWSPTRPLGEAGLHASTHLVIVMDASYSMDFRSGGQSQLERARDTALEAVRQSRQGDGYSLVLLADPPRTIVGEPTFDRAHFMEEIQSVGLSHGGADLLATLSEVDRIVRDSTSRHPRLARRRVLLLSDLGRTTWEAATTEQGRRAGEELARSTDLEIVPLGTARAENVAIARLSLLDSDALVGQDLRIEAEVHDFGSAQRSARRLEFHLDGRVIGEQRFELAPGGRANVAMTCRCETPGAHVVTAILNDDALPLDNRRWLSITTRAAIRVLCIEGRPGDARYLALALQPKRTEQPRLRVDVAAENALLEKPLGDYEVVCLCNIGRFTRAEGQLLSEYVRGGGGLVVFPGDLTQPETYDTELGGSNQMTRVLPARLGAPVNSGEYRFDPDEYRDPLVAPFRGQERAGLLSTPIWKYFPLSAYDESTCHVALRFANGPPALVHETIERGAVILFAIPASPEVLDRSLTPPQPWTMLGTWPSFVPLVQQSVNLLLSSQQSSQNLMVGQPWTIPAPRGAALPRVTITGPSVETGSTASTENLLVDSNAHPPRWTFVDTQHCGTFHATMEPPVTPSLVAAVNLDTRESNLEQLDPQLLPDVLARAATSTPESPVAPISASQAPLFRVVLTVLLGVLVSESLITWWFGRRRQ